MKLHQLSAAIERTEALARKINNGEPLTDEERRQAELEFPPSKRCSCCGKILGFGQDSYPVASTSP